MATVCSVFLVNRQVPAEEEVFDARDVEEAVAKNASEELTKATPTVTFNSRRLWETTGNAQCLFCF